MPKKASEICISLSSIVSAVEKGHVWEGNGSSNTSKTVILGLLVLLRGTIKDVGELVRVGTQIERDFDESKRYWSQANVEEQKKKVSTVQEPQRKPPHASNRVVQSFQNSVQHDYKNITLPIILQDRYAIAMVDTGSTFSLIQKSFWKQLCHQEQYQPSEGQSFLLANGQKQTAIGKVKWKCEVHGQTVDLTFFIMRDADLTVPIILGMDFLLKTGMVLDFHKAQYSLPTAGAMKVKNLSLCSSWYLPHHAFLPCHFFTYLQ